MLSLQERAGQLEEQYITLRRTIHRNPETAFKETATSRLIAQELAAYGIETAATGAKTGVVGILRGAFPGKTVALRADIDALPIEEKTGLSFSSQTPGVCHACGHDLHTAALLAAARLLAERRSALHGTVKFFFQPAEEKLAGAQTMIAQGFLDAPRVDAIFGLHTWPELPAGSIGVSTVPMMAGSDHFVIKIHASGGHAAHPHKTADPIVAAAFLITQLQTIVSRELNPIEPAVVTVGKMTAGTAANIIPSEVTLEGTVRTVSRETQTHIRAAIERMATFGAQSFNTSAEVEYHEDCPPLIPDQALNQLVRQAAVALLGEKQVSLLSKMSMGSEDFSQYLQKVPGTLFRLGTGDNRPESRLPLHNPKLLFNEKAIMVGALALCGAVALYTGSNISETEQM